MNVKVDYYASGRSFTWETTVYDGELRVQLDQHQLASSEELYPIGWVSTCAAAWLNGELILDPARAQQLANEAGIDFSRDIHNMEVKRSDHHDGAAGEVAPS